MWDVKLGKRVVFAVFALGALQCFSACASNSGANDSAMNETANENAANDGAANGSAGVNEAKGATQAEVSGVSGKLLTSVVISDKHQVDFYDFGDGLVGAHETMPIGEPALLDAQDRKMSLQELYALVNAGSEVPASLVEAQQRADIYNREHKMADTIPEMDQVAPGSRVKQFEAAAAKAVKGENVASASQAVVSCSSDLLGDNWGAQWFLDNYCNEGCFRNCYTNSGSVNWHTTKDWFRWKQFNGDFNVSARTVGERSCSICAAWSTVWSYNLAPRSADIWTMTGGHQKAAFISSTCGHANAAALRCD